MTWNVRAIATPAVAVGFRLAGVPVDSVADLADAGTLLIARSTEPGLGILLVEQPVHDAAPVPVRRELERRPAPIVVPVPSPMFGAGPADTEGLIVELLRRAIGYRVRL